MPAPLRLTRLFVLFVLVTGATVASPSPGAAQAAPPAAAPAPRADAPARVVLAIGAHAGDMELTTGAVLAKAHADGARVVLLHLTLGEGGNPKMSPADYGAQKKREAEAAAKVLGAEVLFGPYRDGELPDSEEARRYVADVIRQVRPSLVLTHWRHSMHKDHRITHALVTDAVLLASLAGVASEYPAHRGVRGVWYAENWEDAEGFVPFVYMDVSSAFSTWREAVTQYEFVRGGISSFTYLDYYSGLATMRGALARARYAVAFDIESYGKRRVVGDVP